MIGAICPDEPRTSELIGHSPGEIHTTAIEQLGVQLSRAAPPLTALAAYPRVDGVGETEAVDRGAVFAKVSDKRPFLEVRTARTLRSSCALRTPGIVELLHRRAESSEGRSFEQSC